MRVGGVHREVSSSGARDGNRRASVRRARRATLDGCDTATHGRVALAKRRTRRAVAHLVDFGVDELVLLVVVERDAVLVHELHQRDLPRRVLEDAREVVEEPVVRAVVGRRRGSARR